MDLYKRYSRNNLERYSLEYVSQFELGKGKLDYSEQADDLRQLYDADWNKYVDYNVVDCKRVHDLGQKLGYIRLVQSLSLLTRVPMRYYNAMTSLIEGALLVHYRRNNLCAPILEGGSQETFDAAYVKEPQKGMHKWLFSVDIQSSYPSHIITLNMSNETYYGRILNMTEDAVIECMKRREFPSFRLYNGRSSADVNGIRLDKFNMAVQRKLFSIAPCGTVFVNRTPGVLATVERSIFEKRLELKKLMREEKNEERKGQLDSNQQALKILLNSMFGITAVPYSRYFSIDIAEAIVSCGRYTLRSGEHYTNELLNSPNEELKKTIEKFNDFSVNV
jgi:DNA polymerase elongation subunit (family B)